MRILYVLRGISGSGKTTFGKKLTSTQGAICSADNYFVDERGVYNFDSAYIGEAHAQCYDKFINLLNLQYEEVVLDNTNVTRDDFKRYVTAAKEHGYQVLEITIGAPWKIDKDHHGKFRRVDLEYVKECHARNKHAVPYETILKQAMRWES